MLSSAEIAPDRAQAGTGVDFNSRLLAALKKTSHRFFSSDGTHDASLSPTRARPPSILRPSAAGTVALQESGLCGSCWVVSAVVREVLSTVGLTPEAASAGAEELAGAPT